MNREISPPPTKRRKLSTAAPKAPSRRDTGLPLGSDENATEKTVRVFSWNINGIYAFISESTAPITSFFKPLKYGSSPSRAEPPNSIRAFLSRHEWPEILFLQELKINLSDTKTPAALLSVLNKPLSSENDELPLSRTYELHLVLPRDKHNATGFQGKLYGVGTIVRADFARKRMMRVRGAEWDLEGRVSIIETNTESDTASIIDETTASQQKRPLALVNVYAVNGTSAPYRSPTTGVVTGTRHDHKLAFHSRLRDECRALEARGFDVVIAGDLNVARGPWDGYPRLRTWPAQHCANRADFNAKFFGVEDCERANASVGGDADKRKTRDALDETEACFDGVDVFRAIRGDERRFTYHPRTKEWGASCDRVDLIIVSKSLWQSGRVTGTAILDTPQERGPSDHVPLWIEISL